MGTRVTTREAGEASWMQPQGCGQMAQMVPLVPWLVFAQRATSSGEKLYQKGLGTSFRCVLA